MLNKKNEARPEQLLLGSPRVARSRSLKSNPVGLCPCSRAGLPACLGIPLLSPRRHLAFSTISSPHLCMSERVAGANIISHTDVIRYHSASLARLAITHASAVALSARKRLWRVFQANDLEACSIFIICKAWEGAFAVGVLHYSVRSINP